MNIFFKEYDYQSGYRGDGTIASFWHANGPNGLLSNWAPTPFTVDGVTFPTMEHWMMCSKALLFKDQVRYKAILRDADPRRAKAFGKVVTGFNSYTWDQYKVHVVYIGCCHKFLQDKRAMNTLLSTGSSLICESSPMDKVWGTGIHTGTAPETWTGQSLLGMILMKVREQLVASGATITYGY